MKRAIVVVMLTCTALFPTAWAQNDQADAVQQKVIGTWKLVSYVGEEVPSGARADVMGPHPSGYINYSRDGRMIVIIVGSDRNKPAGQVPTPQEAQALIRSMLAYAGTYTIDATAQTVTHHVDVSWDQTRTGESHLRKYKFDGDRLVLTTQPSRDPATGKQTVRTVTWEKVK